MYDENLFWRKIMFEIEAKGNGPVKSTAKGNFIRKFMVQNDVGEV